MTLLDKMEKLVAVEQLELNCNDDVCLQITNLTPQIAKDFIRFQSIDETGWVYIPNNREKLDLAEWFKNRGCTVKFTISKELHCNLIKKWQLLRKIKTLNDHLYK